MVIWLYSIAIFLSVVTFVIFSNISIKTTSRYMFLLFGLVIVCNIGYLSIALSRNIREALLANRFTYMGGVFLPFLLVMTVSSLCDLEMPRFIIALMQFYSLAVFAAVCTIGYNELYYKDVAVGYAYGGTFLKKVYGPLHNLYIVMLLGELAACFFIVIYSIIKKKKVSLRTTLSLAIGLGVGTFIYLFERIVHINIDLMPFVYIAFETMVIMIITRMNLYDLSAAIAETYDNYYEYAYITLDRDLRFMNCNETAKIIYPELDEIKADSRDYIKNGDFYRDIISWTDDYTKLGDRVTNRDIERNGKYFIGTIKPIGRKVKNPVGFLIELEDNTRQQEYIRVINRYNSELQTEIHEKTEERNEADAANKAKTTFLANMSHEIRTPINSILGMNEMILKEAKDPDIIDYADSVQNAGYTLLSLINDILDISKIEAGNMDLILTEYSVAELIKYEISILSTRASDKGLELKMNADPYMPRYLKGDEVRIRQIITNFLTNGIKYTSRGSVSLDLSAKEDSENENRVILIIEVKDTGQGIKKENLERIFDSFSRVNEEKNRYIEGTGLGLAITHDFVKLMDGTIEVESTYGEGSLFRASIPQEKVGKEIVGNISQAIADDKKDQDSDSDKPKEGLKTRNTNIFVVDDNAMNLKVVNALLKNTGINTICLRSGEEALEAMEKLDFDLVLMDHMMPVMDGIETFHKYRELHPEDTTPFIALTANAVSGSREMYLKEGFNDYLSKPMTGKELEDIIRKWLPEEKIVNTD
ncbi:MAG: response regulator [Lachnospiraceae bacterium]|nr:response regulator [Lachnospiraceae bacterium]